jgi:outer membrane protein OmpA-like peptidoglycan-associated protein
MTRNAERVVLLSMVAGGMLGACSYSQPTLHKAPVREVQPSPAPRPAGPVAVPDGRSAAAPPAPAPAPPPPPPPPPAAEEPPALPAAPAEQPGGVIYFDSDVFRVSPQYRPMLEDHARRLKADPSRRLRIEAYADPEGGADYNRALSEKRAETVMKMLRSMGVSARQLDVRAHGAGRVDASDPAAWSRSRRVELVYQ